VNHIQLSPRQERIVDIVKGRGPVTGEQIASELAVSRATLRPDLTILTMSGILEARPRVGYFYSGRSPRTVAAEEIRRLLVQDCKSIPVVVRETTSAYDAIVTMFTENVGTLAVVSDGSILEGVISRKDMLKASLGQTELRQVPVAVLMTRMPNVVTVLPEETVYAAARRMIEQEVNSLPVVRPLPDPGGKGRESLQVIGRITKTTITRLFMELGEGR